MSKSDYNPTTGIESVSEVQKNAIYDWLTKEFDAVRLELHTAELQTDLDGKLWKLAGTLAEAGMWKALEVALDEPGEKHFTFFEKENIK
jgi:hypothetical protein